MTQVALYLFALVFVWAVYQIGLRWLRCPYCGRIATHEPHCPYSELGR